MEKYGLELGDTVTVNLTAEDTDTGDVTFRIPDLTLTVVGVIDNVTGFTDRKNGYVSEALARKILREKNGRVNAVIRFANEEKIPENVDKLNAYLGYGEEESETLKTRINYMLAEAVSDGGTLKKQNTVMNVTVWLVISDKGSDENCRDGIPDSHSDWICDRNPGGVFPESGGIW